MNPGLRGVGAVVVGKTARAASRVTGKGGGSSLPGVVARRVSPTVLRDLVGDAGVPVIAVTGSNGKTTTSRFITEMLVGEGLTVSQNRDGANLVQGVTSLAVQTAGWNGRIPEGTVLVTEVDEGALRLVAPETSPRVLVVTNLFRDQLDRFGEIYAISDVIAYAARHLPDESVIVVNADDPLTAELGAGGVHRRLTFGLELEQSYGRITSAADSIRCPRCRGDLDYSEVYLSHLGRYRCQRCDFTRPPVDVAVVELVLDGLESTRLRLRTPQGEIEVTVPQPGLHIAYDVAGAVAAVVAAGHSLAHAAASLRNVGAAFGRLETVHAGDREIVLAFAKNPTSFNTNLSTLLAAGEPRNLLLALSNTRVDGEDFGWLWDVDFESIAPTIEQMTVSGLRADEIATRMKYAGVPVGRTTVVADRSAALDTALSGIPGGETLIVLAGYTPTIELRDAMRQRGWVGRRWDA
ncbi:MAG TPA: MurT ligase domain-containing protein [Actinomycetes bacterium]|nr:MurT ligase domain-containing protein [Actinomycetes bacterium]